MPQQKQKSTEDLPYRSVDIDVSSFGSARFGKSFTSDELDTERTDDGIRIDSFNNSSDISYRAYNEASELTILNKSTADNESELEPAEMPGNKRIFLVCYHLPIKLTKDETTGDYSAEFTESLIAKTKHASVTQSHETFWIGTVSDTVKTEEEREKIRKVLEPLNCLPLFLDSGTVDSFYFGMCKQVLWPAFHNIDLLDIAKSGWGKNELLDEGHYAHGEEVDSDWDQSRLDGWWNAFCAVNKYFAEEIMKVVRQNDIIWVHDYHLSLLPKLLHEAEVSIHGNRTIQMVFFLHIPFPTSQVFRELERGEHILEGMLYADVIGFHAFDHARHFLNASKRILGLSHESLVGGLIGVRYRGTKVLVTISNVSIEADVIGAALDSQIVQDEAERLKLTHRGRSIIAGVDIAQGLSGVSLKLLAFEKLLADYPNWREKIVMVQCCLIPSSRKSDERDTLRHIRYVVKRIQKSFGGKVIDYEEVLGSSLPKNRRLAIWLASDVFMSTPIREGLTLLPLEYVFAHKSPMAPGVTITSEFAAVCSILNGALRVNPYDIQMTATSIDTALSMTLEEKISRRERDIQFVSTSSSGLWTRRVLRDLNDVTMAAKKSIDGYGFVKCPAKMDSVNATSDMYISSAPLDIKAVIDAYDAAKKRVIFVDFNGTIVMKEPTGKYLKREMLGTSGNEPPLETMKALTKLCADERNTVYVVSGDTENNIENAIGHIQGLGLASGNGGSMSRPTLDGRSARKWNNSNLGVDWNAIQQITLPILSKYTARANGSYVKLTSSSIGWSYYSCDPEWGNMLASPLVEELEHELQGFDVRLVTLKGIIEVVPRKLNKGVVVKEVLRSSELPDFILCMGDDVSDEKMFTSVFSVIAQACAQESAVVPTRAFTVTVGKKVSKASYFVESAEDVADLLIRMSGEEYSSGRAMSWDGDDDSQIMFES